ncbi:ribosome maturation factor RimM [Planctomonas psychrotolerans]|uniref:ribosome maturation factor RimM n=1 Tax=Planctomonas psychrotolerans TaxID=2528712 RepID=UPI00123A847F
MPSKQTELRVGRLTKAHGLKGALKLELYTDDPARRFVPGAVFTLQVPTGSRWRGKTLEVVELRWYNSQPVVFFKGITDRTEAETLVKAILWISQDETEQSDEEDAWYDHQLVGLSVVRDGIEVGTVTRVEHFPAQDILLVATPSGEVMVPFVKAIVPSVDMARRTVTVTPPAGLFEEIPETEDAAPEDVDASTPDADVSTTTDAAPDVEADDAVLEADGDEAAPDAAPDSAPRTPGD